MKTLDVNAKVLNVRGEVYTEPKLDAKGRYVTVKGDAKFPNQMTKDDEPALEEKKIGEIMIYALELPDDKAAPKERVARFTLACRIQECLESGGLLALREAREDENRISAAAELITNNNMFVARIEQALESAA